jgi:hypothetical protein
VALAEPSLLLTSAYSVPLKETHCPLTPYSDGSWYLRVDGFVYVFVYVCVKPAAGRAIQQYVDATQMPYVTVTLTPIAGIHAQEAHLVLQQHVRE